MKSFNEWLEKIVDKDFKKKWTKDGEKSKGLYANNWNEKVTSLYSAYQNYLLVEKTKWLVRATWALAIGTLLILIFK